ncbi:MAG: carbon-nitrogen hydrolase family protein [Acidobacteria bacterium]|nr:carbon-nitrogen hydrolase family protein [Acidobacteriota bacterium]
MKISFLAGLLVAVSQAAEPLLQQSGFVDPASGWTKWSAREEIAPRRFVDSTVSIGEPGSLAVSGNSNAAAYGGWERDIPGVAAGRWYRFSAAYRATGVGHENLQVLARLDWRTAEGKRAGQPEYVWRVEPLAGGWRRVSLEAAAPPKSAAARIQLYLQNAPQATVWWDDISFRDIAAPGPRKVTVAAVNLRPQRTGSAHESVARFVELVDQQVNGADVVLLPEGITIVSTGKSYADVAETIPGPVTATLGELAKRKNAYVAAGIYEREGHAMYNTAVLIGRKGEVVGKYRKVYLPREEIEGGLTPGNDYPVFDTDFGKVGIMICWDVQYADPARALALRGAELVLLPIWGGNEALGKARAIENRVFIASSGYNYPTYVMDPDGEILSIARTNGSIATATLDLNRSYADEWLGEMRGRMRKELRTDVR